MRSVRGAAVLLGAALAAILLVGCTPGATGAVPTSEPPSPSAVLETTSPTPTVDPITTVDGLVARPQALELRSDGVAVTTLPYMSSPEEAVAVLTEVFGAPPVEEPYDGGNHRPDGVYHHWDPFVLDERFYDGERRESGNLDWVVWPRFAVYFDGPAVGPIVLSAANGRQAGDPWSDAEADESFDDDIWTCVGTSIEAEAIDVPTDHPDRVNVVVTPSDDGQSVKWIGAPEMEAVGCT